MSIPEVQDQKAIVDYLDALEMSNSQVLAKELPNYLEAQRHIVARIDELAARIEEGRELRRRAVDETKP